MPGVADQVQAELQDYLNVKGVNALFVSIVEGLLIEKPANPIAFIIEFLCKSYPELAVQARIPELLQAQRADLDAAEMEAEEEAGQDDMTEDEEQLLVISGQRRGGVSAGAMTQALGAAPKKTQEEKARIAESIQQSAFLRSLDPTVHEQLIAMMIPRDASPGEVLIQAGADASPADEFFIVEQGAVEMSVPTSDPSSSSSSSFAGGMKVVKQLAPGDTFGELALLHNAPQSATFAVPAAVEADRCRLWVLGRDAYRMTLFKAAEARRNRYKGFLRGVSCLAPLSDYDILALADACHEDTIPPGGLAYMQGDPTAHRLSVVFKGVASCTLVNAAGDDMEVARLAEGDHFVEDPSNPTETPTVRASAPEEGKKKRPLVLLRLDADVILRLTKSILTVHGLEPPNNSNEAMDSVRNAMESLRH